MKTKAAVLWLLCIVVLLAAGRVFYWTYWRTRMAENPGVPLVGGNSPIKWKQILPDKVTSSPVIGNDGSIYTTIFSGAIYALDRSGDVRWTYHIDLNDIPSALMRDAEDNLYFSTTKKVFSLSKSGQKRWETECAPQSARIEQGAALTRDVLYTTCGKNFAALATTDGRELWKLPYPFIQYNTAPIVLRSGAIVVPQDWSLTAVDRNGNSLWNFPPPRYIEPRPRPGLTVDRMLFSSGIAVGSDESLYLGSGEGEFSCFSSQGVLNWTYNAGPLRGAQFDASPVITSDGTIIAISTEVSVYAFTRAGDLRWSVRVGDPAKSMVQPSPVVGSDRAIYVLAAGKLVALSAAGTNLWELPLPSDAVTSPTLAPDGTLYIATDDKTLYAVQTTSKGLMNSAWPKYQRDLWNSGSSF
ncbi:MAG TPA: PQQ-binding-like beta-propeller repeat protein [Terriglobales bacterium]|nr:PQQ-binding-like beta-propeller repeat protein [Terriglobales bacterium]